MLSLYLTGTIKVGGSFSPKIQPYMNRSVLFACLAVCWSNETISVTDYLHICITFQK